MYRWARAQWDGACALSNFTQDALLYALAALFAGLNGAVAKTADYREWGVIALGPYVVATVVTIAVALRNRRERLGARRVRAVRATVVGVLGIGVVVAPLLAELTWRATATRQSHAQPEVAVIERAGDRLATGHNPYPVNPSNIGVAPTNDAHGTDASSFFPYLPGMAVFGLLNAARVPRELGDARVLIVLAALMAFFAAVALANAPPERRIRATQFFVALPIGALPMVTGGDDLPVIALVLLALVLLERGVPFGAGVAAAAACALKLTAWPIALLALLATRRNDPARSTSAYLAGLALAVPVIMLGLLGNTHGFVENVVRFPLGLSAVTSPAASPLVGQSLVTAFPHLRRVLTAGLAVAGFAIVVWAYVRSRPRDVVGVTRFAAFALLVATALAPATRFGYLIYPTVLFVWSYVLTAAGKPNADDTRAVA